MVELTSAKRRSICESIIAKVLSSSAVSFRYEEIAADSSGRRLLRRSYGRRDGGRKYAAAFLSRVKDDHATFPSGAGGPFHRGSSATRAYSARLESTERNVPRVINILRTL